MRSLLNLVLFLPFTSPLVLPLHAIIPGTKLVGTDSWSSTDSGPLGPRADNFFLKTFRTQLATSLLKSDSEFQPGYDGMIDIIRLVHSSSSSKSDVVLKSRTALQSLFPNFPPAMNEEVGLLFWFKILFARPLPEFSSKLNTWVTWWASQWLMGHSTIEDLDDAEVGDGQNQLLLVKRCRYLEASSCASVCVNTCKLPTQAFFNEDMGVPMRMIPDYETYACRFEFGKAPTKDDEEVSKNVACFVECPSKGEDRERLSCMS